MPGGKHRLNRLADILTQWCPENIYDGALMAVQSPPHQAEASGDSIPSSIPGTDQAPAPNPTVPPVVDLGELEPMVIDIPAQPTSGLSQYIVPMAGLALVAWAFTKKAKKK